MTDDYIVERILKVKESGGWVAIDAPFGFPAAFVQSVIDWATFDRVTTVSDDCSVRRRLTDRYVAERQHELLLAQTERNQSVVDLAAQLPSLETKGVNDWNPWPLSPVSSLITPTVLRCSKILTRVYRDSPVDRIGLDSGVIEVYPISALRIWDIDTKDYKSNPGDCGEIIDVLCRGVGLNSGPTRDKKQRLPQYCDDEVDAFVCAIVAHLISSSSGATGPEQATDFSGDIEIVRKEGWIHLPPADVCPA